MPSPKETDRRQASFGSSDSTAGGLALPVSLWRAPALLLTFAVLSSVQILMFETGWLDDVFYTHDYVLGPYVGYSSISIRIFILSFFIAFSIFAGGDGKSRFLFCLDLCLRFIALCILLDLGSVAFDVFLGRGFPLVVAQVIAGFAGIGVFAAVLLRTGAMPPPVQVESRAARPEERVILRLVLTGAVATIASVWAAYNPGALFDDLRRITLLGGIGPGIVIFLLVLFAQLFVIAVIERRLLARPDFRPPVSIVVPALNEAYVIRQTISRIDRAAAHYGGEVELIIIDNGSTDGTADIARSTIETCRFIDGRVVLFPTPGKAHALNEGVKLARHGFIIRIDADTQVGEDNLTLAMQNFANPTVGAVGGVPIPPGGALFDPGRTVEVIVKHGFYSPALTAISGLVGIPGMFLVSRAEALRGAGEFASGMNGEDTDISLRIAELGYRTLVDERISYISEVPTSFAHMREQRVRWFRSVYHVSARAHSLITDPNFSVRGKLVLPYMLLNTARRAMMIPLVIYGILELTLAADTAAYLQWQAAAAVLIGSPILAATLAILATGRPRALLSLPPYVLFRTLRSYYTLESALSIPILPKPEPREIEKQRWPGNRRTKRQIPEAL